MGGSEGYTNKVGGLKTYFQVCIQNTKTAAPYMHWLQTEYYIEIISHKTRQTACVHRCGNIAVHAPHNVTTGQGGIL